MPKSTDEGLPMHLWRINTDANYSTFPTQTAFYGGICSINPADDTTIITSLLARPQAAPGPLQQGPARIDGA